jgi:hypothetical protein
MRLAVIAIVVLAVPLGDAFADGCPAVNVGGHGVPPVLNCALCIGRASVPRCDGGHAICDFNQAISSGKYEDAPQHLMSDSASLGGGVS